MKLRLALGIGALALLIVLMVSWNSSLQRSVEGTIVALGSEQLPGLAPDADDLGALLLCTPRGAWPAQTPDRGGSVLVHVLPFTRVLDGRGRFFTSTARFDTLQAGQRVQIWTTEQTLESQPPQVYAIKIQIVADDAAGADGASCRATAVP